MEEIKSLTSRSSELCFNKDDFAASDFSVDKFVSEYRKHTPLETIKEDLGLFLKVLQTAMVELINKDYADFVNLSTNLVGLDKSIKNLSAPLQEVKAKISGVLEKLEQSLFFLQSNLKKRSAIHENKLVLHNVMCVLEGIENIKKQNLEPVVGDVTLSAEVIERIAVEYSRIQFHVYQNSSDIRQEQSVVNHLSDCLLQHLEILFVRSISDCNVENMFKILRVYSTIDKVQDVENIFRIKIVRPYMRQVINEDFVVKTCIDEMYDAVLDFVPQKCDVILDITRGTKKNTEGLKGYDFLVNAVWPEIVLCLEYIAALVFAPGNPDLFHKNYTSSMLFEEKFEKLCVVQTSVQRLREHSSYKLFMDKWQLYVYFEIRFREIASHLENTLRPEFPQESNRDPFFLNSTTALWHSISQCWDSKIYIEPLCYRFWKLTLQLLSRYYNWVIFVLKAERHSNEGCEKSSPSVVQLVMLVKDIEVLTTKVPKFYEESVVPNLKIVDNITKEALQETLQLYRTLPARIGQVIVDNLSSVCIQHLRPVKDIPRLYRKTNREVPSKASSYVAALLVPLNSFLLETECVNLPEWKSKWTADIINCITEQFLAMTTDVLTSVKKMEDSLKRLKKVREKPAGQGSMGTMSDDDKIRQQLFVDIDSFGQEIEKHGVNRSNVNYKKLQDLVLSAVKTGVAL